ncbi:MAG: TonB-dependent receptor plug domain-containing protein [Saprospiraceae bacterium]
MGKYTFLKITPLKCLMLTFLTYYPANDIMNIIISKLDQLIHNFPQEKVYVHTDKPHYTLGDTIWFSLTATDASFHEKPSVSKLVYVQLIGPDSTVLSKKSILINEKWGKGEFALKDSWEDGKYTIQAFTNYMMNYSQEYIFSKEINIWDANKSTTSADTTIVSQKENLQIKFYPEGGDLVENLTSVVAFEAIYENGDPAEGELLIKDEKGNIITQTRTLYEGKGFFTIKPDSYSKYHGMMDDKIFNLPYVKREGYNIKVNNKNKDFVSVTLQTNIRDGLMGTFLIGHIRGQVFLTKDGFTDTTLTLKIEKKSLPAGVSQFTLFSKDGLPLCERAVFIENASEKPHIDIASQYAFHRLRSKADISISVNELVTKKGLKGDFSISVFDKNQVNFSNNDLDIRSYFLLTSDLTKHVTNPGYYFIDESPKRKTLLDLVMMTHAWTRIKSDYLITQFEPILSHAPESGLVIRGTVLKKGSPLESAKVDLVVLSDDYLVGVANTDKNGKFVFDELPVTGKQTISIKASEVIPGIKSKESTDGVELMIEEMFPTFKNTNNNYINGKTQNGFDIKEYLAKESVRHKYDSLYTAMSVQLDEVTVKANKKRRSEILKKERGILYNNYDKRLELDSLPYINPNWTIYDMVAARSPGIQVIGSRSSVQKFRIRGNNSIQLSTTAQVLVDGAPVTDEYAGSLNIQDVEFVDIIRGLSATSIFGAQGANGIVAIYLRKERNYSANPLSSKFQHRINFDGYTQAREFYSPNYAIKSAGTEKPDLRTTLYWSPLVSTDDKCGASFSFYTGDVPSEYLIHVQGITEDGRPFSALKILEVRE